MLRHVIVDAKFYSSNLLYTSAWLTSSISKLEAKLMQRADVMLFYRRKNNFVLFCEGKRDII